VFEGHRSAGSHRSPSCVNLPRTKSHLVDIAFLFGDFFTACCRSSNEIDSTLEH
jgi:hypothetical protein